MKNYLSAFLILLALTFSAASQTTSTHGDLQSLVEAERAFARTALDKGIREAFIANLADDAVLFRPRAVAGKRWMEENASQPGVLTWQPVFAFVSRAGDLGYTYGTYDLKAGADAKETESGNYMRIWRKQRDGKRRIVLDLLNPIPKTQS